MTTKEIALESPWKQMAKGIVFEAAVPIEDFVESPRNANVMDEQSYRQLVENIRRVGFLQPILAIRKGKKRLVVDGNHRLRAAKEAGFTTLPAFVADLGEDLARIQGLAMNRLRGDPDMTEVSSILNELAKAGWEGEDLLLTGFSHDEIIALIGATDDRSLEDIENDLLDDKKDMEPEESDAPDYSVTIEFGTKEQRRFFKRAMRQAANKRGDAAGALQLAASFLDEKIPTT